MRTECLRGQKVARNTFQAESKGLTGHAAWRALDADLSLVVKVAEERTTSSKLVNIESEVRGCVAGKTNTSADTGEAVIGAGLTGVCTVLGEIFVRTALVAKVINEEVAVRAT